MRGQARVPADNRTPADGVRTPQRRPGPEATGGPGSMLALQRTAGNRAAVALIDALSQPASPTATAMALVQRAPTGAGGTHLENDPVRDVHPAGTLSDDEWRTAYLAAKRSGLISDFLPLFTDIAHTAGIDSMAGGFSSDWITLADEEHGRPGLNLVTGLKDGAAGRTVWVDRGAFASSITVERDIPPVSVAIILAPGALHSDKGESLTTIRHEMVHASHHYNALMAMRAWKKSGSRKAFVQWLHDKRSKVSPLDAALDESAVDPGRRDSELLAYVEGFMTTFHRDEPTLAAAQPAFFELLGVVEAQDITTWLHSQRVVHDEAVARLRAYYGTLDGAHRLLWKQWLDQQKPAPARPGHPSPNAEFLGELRSFVVGD